MSDIDADVAALRRFSRFYTRQIELLDDGLLDSPFALTEARILYELAHRDGATAGDLGRDLGIDPGYLSRILKRFVSDGLLERAPSGTDGRQWNLAITEAGRRAFAPLEAASRRQAAAMLSRLTSERRAELTQGLRTVERLLDQTGAEPEPTDKPAWRLRPHRVGDIGLVASRQGLLYAGEYGWDGTFEALVAEIMAKFVRELDPARERAWIAETADGRMLGSVLLVRGDEDGTAKLRLLYVEPETRGLGIGARLVAECIAFARACGYGRLTLWTNDCLAAARRLYQAEGFRLVSEETHRSFGHDLVGQYWALDLSEAAER